MESEGWEKIGAAVAGSEVEGLYGLLRGVVAQSLVSHVPPPSKKCHHAPTYTVSKLPPQEPEGVPEASMHTGDRSFMAPEVPPSAASLALEEALPFNMQPFCLQLGVLKECANAGLKVAKRGHQPYML